MGGDANQFHVAFFCAAFCRRSLGDDGRVFVFHAVAHLAFRQHIQKKVVRRGKTSEVGNLRIGKVLVLLHKPLLVWRSLPVHPDVKWNAVRGVGAVPQVGPRKDGAVHGMLDVPRVKFSVI